METTFIYFLRDPKIENKGYVGKSDSPKIRFKSHMWDGRNEKFYRARWLKTLSEQGLKPKLELVDEVKKSEWRSAEAAYIEFFREQGYVLVNSTAGGEGVDPMCGDKNPFFGRKHTQEFKERQRTNRLGTKAAPETCAAKRIKTAHASSKFHGVSRAGNRWRAQLYVLNKRISLGGYATDFEAACAYDNAAKKHCGSFAVLNFP